jgi:phthiocerol/phenolphthiocerol synthesis type-I polyketide synthase E
VTGEATAPEWPNGAPARRGPAPLALEDWFERPGWELVPDAPARAAGREPCLVFGGGELLLEGLRAAGWAATRGGAEAVLTDSAQYARLLDAHDPGRIVVAWGLDPDAGPPLERALFSLLALGKALAERAAEREIALDVLTAGACPVLDGERCEPELATVAGPLRVLPLELPHVRTRHVDLPAGASGRAATQAVAAELAAGGPAVVALRGGRRWAPTLTPVRLGAGLGARAWRERGSYLVTGGLGAIGLAVAEHLATRARARLTLVGRGGLPPREHWNAVVRADPDATSPQTRAILAIGRMERVGADVTVHRADVADAQALRRVRDGLGELDGVFHVAGLAGAGSATGLVEARRRADVEAVLAPKIAGTRALLDVFGDLRPDFVVLFSSLATIVGGVGQVDYCAANAYMDALADEGGTPFRLLSIDWGGWLRSGIWTPRSGDVGMEPQAAIEACRRVLAVEDCARMVVAPVRVTAARPWTAGAQPPAGPLPAAGELDERLARLWAESLGLERVAPDGDFFALGGTSALGVELIWRVADELGCRLPMRALVEGRTPATIARLIEGGQVAPMATGQERVPSSSVDARCSTTAGSCSSTKKC